MEEPDQLVDKSRKRKREGEEERAGSTNEKQSDWVSKMAYEAWRDKLQSKDFNGERGFNKWVSPFQELVESKGWQFFCEHKAPGFVDILKDFYANLVVAKDKTVYVRGKWISFSKGHIDQIYNLKEKKNGSKFKRLLEALDYQKIVDLLTDGKGRWNASRKNMHESIARGVLTETAKVWFYFLCSVIMPSKNLCTVREKETVMLYAILKGYKFSVGKLIENSIMSYFKGGFKGLIPHLALISRLCISGAFHGEWEEEEN